MHKTNIKRIGMSILAGVAPLAAFAEGEATPLDVTSAITSITTQVQGLQTSMGVLYLAILAFVAGVVIFRRSEKGLRSAS